MKKAVCLFLVLGCVMFMAGGCAKSEMVKKDEPVVPVVTAVTVVKEKPVKTDLSGNTPLSQSPIKESAVQNTPQPIPQAGELKASLETIYFNFDAYALSQESRATLVKNAELLKNAHDGKVRIEGNCDDRGSDEYNLALGEKRASAAMQYLVTIGIPADRLSVISYGKEKPANPGHDEAAWAKNRRDEFIMMTN